MINKFKSIKSILAGLYRDLGVNTELNESDLYEWCAEALMLIGSYPQYTEETVMLDVDNHTCGLPNNFLYIKGATVNGKPLAWNNKSIASNYNCPECKIPTCCTEHNFYIRDCNIYTSLNCGKLCFTYLGIPVDEDGYPLMPDDVYFDKALKSYCTYMLDRIQFRKGTLPQQVFTMSERDWLWYVNSARGSAYMPDTATMNRLKNIWVRLIPQQRAYENNFNSLGQPEQRRIH